MKFRVLITKTLDVPKNMYHHLCDTEEEAVKVVKEKLVELDGDVAIVTKLHLGESTVIHRFERVRKAG